MSKSRYIAFISLLVIGFTSTFAQKAMRDNIRKGNRAYRDSVFVDAEINYRKALEESPGSAIAMYNLGNTLANQQKFQEAVEQYQTAVKFEKDKMKLSEIYHNTGVIFQAAKDYAKAIEFYKEALRNNPKDDDTRYNLALCQKLLEDQEQDQQDQNQDNQQNQEEQQQDQQQNQDQQQQQQDQQEQQDNMSKENAEQMLNSVMQDEKDVQEKVQKQQQALQGGRLDKNW